MTTMATLVDNEYYGAIFYMEQSKSMFLKVMNAIEKLEWLGTSSSLSSTSMGEDIRKKVIMI